MKRLMIAMIGAGVALGASALDVGARFESFSTTGAVTVAQLNEAAGGTYWAEAANATNTYTIAAMDAFTCARPAHFAELSDPTNQLQVKTTFGKELSFYANSGSSVEMGSGIYFDSMVKFTVCEDEPSANLYSDAKVVLWLQEQTNTAGTVVGTNLMVKAGYLAFSGGEVTVVPRVYTCGNVLDAGFADVWHRVTIKALPTITDAATVPGFAIFIDGSGSNFGTLVGVNTAKWAETFTYGLNEAAAYLNDYGAVFPSMVQSGNTKSTVTLAAFDGTGALNDVSFTDVAPDFAADYVAPKVSVTIGDDTDEYGTLAEAVAALNALTATEATTVTFQLMKGINFEGPLTINNTDTDIEVVIDLAGFAITNTASSGYALVCESPVVVTDSSEAKTGAIVSDIKQLNSGAVYIGEAGGLDLLAGTIVGWIDINEEAVDVISLSGGAVFTDVLTGLEETEFGGVAEGYTAVARSDESGLSDIVPAYTVVFEVDGTVVDTQTVAANGYATLPADPVKEGYTFTGWSEGADDPIVSNSVFTAQWAVNVYNVVFVDGETATTNSFNYGAIITANDIPAFAGRTGYTAAWDSNPTGVTVTSALTFTAVYTATSYTVTYNLDLEGATNATANITSFTVETEAFTLLAAGCDGYTFEGWTNALGEAVTTIAGGATGDVALYASWTADEPEPTVDPIAPDAGGTATFDDAAKAAAAADTINADKETYITAPEGVVDTATYYSYVEAVADGTTVTVELTAAGEAAAQTSADADVVSLGTGLDAAATSDEGGTASVSTIAGLYYSVLSGTAPDAVTTEGTRVLGTGGTVQLTLPNKGVKGFYKVKVSATK